MVMIVFKVFISKIGIKFGTGIPSMKVKINNVSK